MFRVKPEMLVVAMAIGVLSMVCTTHAGADGDPLMLLPYPQEVKTLPGRLPLGPSSCATQGERSATEKVAAESLGSYLPKSGKAVRVRLGSVEEGYGTSWLENEDRAFLEDENTSPEACVLKIEPSGITIVGKGKWGMLYGAQTINQLAIDARRDGRDYLPCLEIRDWPDMKWRCQSPAMTWYSGYNRIEGYDLCNWTLDEWKWLVEWTLLHKCNVWAMCMYGYWPFTLPGHESNELDVDSYFYNSETGQKEPWRFTHRNIRIPLSTRCISIKLKLIVYSQPTTIKLLPIYAIITAITVFIRPYDHKVALFIHCHRSSYLPVICITINHEWSTKRNAAGIKPLSVDVIWILTLRRRI